jgi:hypothetical protein
MTGENITNDPRDLFISHRTCDDAWAENLQLWLELSGIQVWIDNADIHPGESVPGAINRGLEMSRHVALVMTPEYFADSAEWTAAEWEAALFSDPTGRHSRVIPLHVKNCPYIPPLLSHLDWIDFRDENNYAKARNELLRILQGRPVRRTSQIAGQVIKPGGLIAKETLFVERASINSKPDTIEENLASNLLPALRIPQFVWSIPIARNLGKQTRRGIAYPLKDELKAIIRDWQFKQKLEHPFMPIFTRHDDSLWTLHNPNHSEHPLAPITESEGTKRMEVASVLATPDHRIVLSGLIRACISRHCYSLGLVQDEKERYLFSSPNGIDVAKHWKLKNPAKRTVTKRYTREDGTTNFYYHDALWVRVIFIGERLYLRIKPTLAFSNDGTTATLWQGARVGPMAMHWTARQQNIDVFRDVRFWIYILAKGRSTICIRAGDQPLSFDTRPATIHLRGGIEDDQSDIEELLERLPVSSGEREVEFDQNLQLRDESDDAL